MNNMGNVKPKKKFGQFQKKQQTGNPDSSSEVNQPPRMQYNTPWSSKLAELKKDDSKKLYGNKLAIFCIEQFEQQAKEDEKVAKIKEKIDSLTPSNAEKAFKDIANSINTKLSEIKDAEKEAKLAFYANNINWILGCYFSLCNFVKLSCNEFEFQHIKPQSKYFLLSQLLYIIRSVFLNCTVQLNQSQPEIIPKNSRLSGLLDILETETQYKSNLLKLHDELPFLESSHLCGNGNKR